MKKKSCKLFIVMFYVCSVIFSTMSADALAAQAGNKHFAYIAAGLKIPFWATIAKGIEETAKNKGYAVTIYDSDYDAKRQVRNAVEAIRQGVDGIIITPMDSSTCPSVLMLAQRSGIPTVIADVGTKSGEYVSYISSDNRGGAYEVGKLMAEKLKSKGWSRGTVGMVAISQKRLNGQARTAGFMKALGEAGVKGAAIRQMQNFSQEETFNFVQNMVTEYPELRGIWLQTSHICKAAIRALKATGKTDKILLAAFDAEPEFVQWIREGKIIGSGMQQPYLVGVKAMKAMDDHLKGEKITKSIVVRILPVSQDNLEENLPMIEKYVFGRSLK